MQRLHHVGYWVDDLDSRVDIVATALADLRGMARLGSGLARGSIRVPRLRGASLTVPHQVPHRKESVERDHLPGEAFEPHPAAAGAKPGAAPAARA